MEFKSKIYIFLVFFLFIAICGCTTTSNPPTSNIDAILPQEIAGPMTISKPGYYQLTQDVVPTNINSSSSGSCLAFRIKSNDVIFDGMGHVIDGGKIDPLCKEWSDGFYIKDQTGNPNYPNIIIRNLTVSNWQGGIELHGVHEFTVENVTITGSKNGISFDGSSNVYLNNNTITKNLWAGVWGRDNENVIISGNTIIDNQNEGIHLDGQIESPVEINILTKRFFLTPFSTINKNTTTGSKNLIYRNEIRNNKNDGIYIANSEGIIIENNSIFENGRGLWLEKVDNTKILGNIIVNNSINIIFKNCGPNIIVSNDTVSENIKVYNYPESVPVTIIIGTFLVYLLKLIAGTSKVAQKVSSSKVLKRFSDRFKPIEEKISAALNNSKISFILKNNISVSILGACVLGGAFTYTYLSSFGLKIEVFAALTFIGGIVLIIPKAVQYLVANKGGMSAEYRLWWGGMLVIFLTTSLLNTVFGLPVRTAIKREDEYEKKNLALTLLIGPLVSLIFSVSFLLLFLMKGTYASLALTGLNMSLLSALVSFLPISPMEGEQVFKWNKLVWVVVFVPIVLAYGYFLILY